MIDIGGHVGLWTCFLAKAVGPRGNVISIEGSPDNYNNLLFNIGLNRCTNVETWNIVLGASEKPCVLSIDLTNDGANALGNKFEWLAQKVGNALKGRKLTEDELKDYIGDRHTAVESVPVDFITWWQENYANVNTIDFMKVDIEGGEKFVNFSPFFDKYRIPFVMSEVDGKLNMDSLLNIALHKHHYVPYCVEPTGLKRSTWDSTEISRNVYFILE